MYIYSGMQICVQQVILQQSAEVYGSYMYIPFLRSHTFMKVNLQAFLWYSLHSFYAYSILQSMEYEMVIVLW